MQNNKTLSWWQFGMAGGLLLFLATFFKLLAMLTGILQQNIVWSELLQVALTTFFLGFICGCVLWILKPLSSRWGLVGDAIIGAVTINVYGHLILLIVELDFLRVLWWENKIYGLSFLGVFTVSGAGTGILHYLNERREKLADQDQNEQQPPT